MSWVDDLALGCIFILPGALGIVALILATRRIRNNGREND